jgi:exonuclease SbcD
MGKLREVYPNVLNFKRVHLEAAGDAAQARRGIEKLTHRELFAAFFQDVTGDGLREEESAAYVATVESLERQEREGAP